MMIMVNVVGHIIELISTLNTLGMTLVRGYYLPTIVINNQGFMFLGYNNSIGLKDLQLKGRKSTYH